MFSMKALVIHEFGNASILKLMDVAKPTIKKPTDVLIAIKASGVNPVDFKLRSGYLNAYMPLTFPTILGIDYSGEVAGVGEGVSNVKIGDAVYGKFSKVTGQGGTYAEFIVVDSSVDAVLLKPEQLSFEEAAGVGVVALTAYVQLIDHGKVDVASPDGKVKKVLVVGASGGVGAYAVQIAKILKAHVTAICSTPNIDYVKSLGADAIIDYKMEDVGEALAKIGTKFDAVADCVGGEKYFNIIQPFLITDGSYSTSVGPKGKMVMGLPIPHFTVIDEWFKEGKLKPLPSTTFPLAKGGEAHLASETQRTVGKIVLLP